MNKPNAANTSEHTQASSAHVSRSPSGRSAPANRPTAQTTAIETSPIDIATTTLTAMYATGFSGVSRSCRLHPTARSTETIAPALVVAIIAP